MIDFLRGNSMNRGDLKIMIDLLDEEKRRIIPLKTE